MKSIQLTNSDKQALVDDDVYDKIKHLKWHRQSLGYIATSDKRGGRIYLHRLILPNIKEVDHINGDKLDNRKDNLRSCSRSQNKANVKPYKNNISGLKGVSSTGKRWRAQIRKSGATQYLGTFDNKVDAARAYDKEAFSIYGTFARLNSL